MPTPSYSNPLIKVACECIQHAKGEDLHQGLHPRFDHLLLLFAELLHPSDQHRRFRFLRLRCGSRRRGHGGRHLRHRRSDLQGVHREVRGAVRPQEDARAEPSRGGHNVRIVLLRLIAAHAVRRQVPARDVLRAQQHMHVGHRGQARASEQARRGTGVLLPQSDAVARTTTPSSPSGWSCTPSPWSWR